MEYFCHFHPTSAARWRCASCGRHFDHACAIPISDNTTTTPECPVCRAALAPLQTETQNHCELPLLSSFLFTSPFMLLICSVILTAAISSFMPVPASILLLLNQSAVFFISFYYGLQIIFSKLIAYDTRTPGMRLSRSRRTPQHTLPGLQSSLKIAIPFAISYILPVYIFYQIHWLAGIILMLAVVAFLSYLLFFMLHQLNARNPLESKKIIAFLSAYKGRIILLNLILYLSTLIITDFAFNHSTLNIALMLGNAAVTFSLMILFYQYGHIYSQFLRKINLDTVDAKVDQSENRGGVSTNKTPDKHPQLSTEIELALKTGNYHQAVKLLEHTLNQNPHSVLRRQQLYLLLSEMNDLERLSRHAELFLSWMLDRGKIREASQFLYRLRKHNPIFALHNLALIAELAKQFTRQKKYALVLWLAESCKKRASPSEDLATIYLSASQVLITHFQDLKKAEEYLLFIIKYCASCESANAAKALLIHLQNNQSRSQQLRE